MGASVTGMLQAFISGNSLDLQRDQNQYKPSSVIQALLYSRNIAILVVYVDVSKETKFHYKLCLQFSFTEI